MAKARNALLSGNSARERFTSWLLNRTVCAGRGDLMTELTVSPKNTFWLGRMIPEAAIEEAGTDERGERLEPCAIGVQVRVPEASSFIAEVVFCVWIKDAMDIWRKHKIEPQPIPIFLDPSRLADTYGETEIRNAVRAVTTFISFSGRIDVERLHHSDGIDELIVSFVNSGSVPEKEVDTRLYECSLHLKKIETIPFMLEELPESYRYERRVPAYGVNCGVIVTEHGLCTDDTVVVDTWRPKFWGAESQMPDLSFESLSVDAISAGNLVFDALTVWGTQNWSAAALKRRAAEENWTEEMFAQAQRDSQSFESELARIREGVTLLSTNQLLSCAFSYMHKAMSIVGKRRGYSGWRPFQFGFLLANLEAVLGKAGDENIADVVWFATGGGKTETYLGILLAAIFFDRLTGKTSGITAWSRFPLRMLSLQQTQRFADALAAAELVRRNENIEGDIFSLGFFIGSNATPNQIQVDGSNTEANANDPDMPKKYRVLESCPFCENADLRMNFNRVKWTLEHICEASGCPWPELALPIYVVDEEIYRFLPTILVGTLDKAALIGMQQALRGLVGAPWGKCTRSGHGYSYAPRSTRVNGCLVPGCNAPVSKVDGDTSRFAPRFRLQDELHLLRDSLGAVDSHYESLYDDLTISLGGTRPKILASSATLKGYARQVEELYRREARLFPTPGPAPGVGFWSSQSDDPMRRYVGIAPRGLTIEWVTESIVKELQTAIRELVEDPDKVCQELGIDVTFASQIISEYGTQVVYGNSLRDIEAVYRSGGMQPLISGQPVNWETLTGKTQFEAVGETLKRLQAPEEQYYDRIHALTASSMMSHGVDVDRLNTMVMLGLPLGSAEFIQATARVGRKYPALVFVVHKIARERDAAVFRMFKEFVSQADRFVEPVPITRRSRRVLDRTLAGFALARLLMLHEPSSGEALTTIDKLRSWVRKTNFDWSDEALATIRALGFDGSLDESLRKDVQEWFEEFDERLRQPPTGARFPNEASPSGAAMKSLRDVDKQVPVIGSRI